MVELDTQEDPKPTPAQEARIAKLTREQVEEIDQAILNAASDEYQKVARVVGSLKISFGEKYGNIPDVYCSARVAVLAEKGSLMVQGSLKNMRYCEIKLSSE